MQTFLPYHSFWQIARCLDDKRLNKQRLEAKQIYLAITDPEYGWQNHPAVNMWRGQEGRLALYGYYMCQEWLLRGFKDNVNLKQWFQNRLTPIETFVPFPKWWDDERVFSSHRAALLAKNYEHYSQFGWTEEPKIDYYWPVK